MYFKKIDKQLVDNLAIESFCETLKTYKPGLTVDNNIRLTEYQNSIEFLKGQFAFFFEFGGEYSCVESVLCFDTLKLTGRQLESKLRSLNGGKNTYIGALFSCALMACAAGKLDALGIKIEIDYLVTAIADFVRNYSFKSFVNLSTKSAELTYGEKLYQQTGQTSIRGSAEEGFSTVLTNGLNFLKNSKDDTNTKYTKLYLLLVSLIDDSRIIILHGQHIMCDIKSKSKHIFLNYDAEAAKNFDIYLCENQFNPKAAMGIHTLCLFAEKLISL